jgi:RNA polymerase sigma-70 factor (ECF subfamily)
MTQANTDHLLFQKIAEGDPRAFRQLVDNHSRPLVTYLTRLMKNQSEAEEVAQEVFVKVWQRAGDYRPSFRATTWLHHIAHNLAVDQMRRRRGNDAVDEEQEENPVSLRPHVLLESKQRALSLQEALDSLPLRQKTAMLLKYEQDFSNPEIASILNLTVDAVESLLARAKRDLKSYLNEATES